MNRVSLIIVICTLMLLGVLFFVSGYKAATGLFHAQLPPLPKAERKVSIDTSTLLASQMNNIKLPGPVEENGINLDTLSGFLPKKIERSPSPKIEAKKNEALQVTLPQPSREKSRFLKENMADPYYSKGSAAPYSQEAPYPTYSEGPSVSYSQEAPYYVLE